MFRTKMENFTTRLHTRMQQILSQYRTQPERGDVPGWVLVTLMTRI